MNDDVQTIQRKSWRKVLRTATEPAFFLYVFALMLHVPLLQQYVYYRISEKEGFPYQFTGEQATCKGNLNSTLKLLQEKVQKTTAYFHIGATMSNTVPSIVVCLFLGTWSDNVGRKPVISMGLLGGVLESIIVLLTMYLELPIPVIYVGSFFNGLGGFFTGLTLAVMAYIADTTEKDKRALRLGILEAVVFTAAMLSNFSSGHLISNLGFKKSYILVVVCFILAFLYGTFVLPESLQRPSRSIKNLFGMECFGYPKRVWQVLTKPRSGKWKIGYMLAAALMINMLTMGVGQVITLYVLNSPFCWPSIEIGYFIGTRFMLLGLGAALGIKFLGKCMPEYFVAVAGLLSYASFYVLLAFAKTKSLLYIACFAGCLSGTCGPIFRGILSKTVGTDEQGSLFSAVSSLEMLCVFAGAFTFNSFYPFANKQGHPGATFLLIAFFLTIPFVLNAIYIYKLRKEGRENLPDTDSILEGSDEFANPTTDIANPASYGTSESRPTSPASEHSDNEK